MVLSLLLSSLFGIEIRNPEQIPITDKSISTNNKPGMGILIRTLLSKRRKRGEIMHADNSNNNNNNNNISYNNELIKLGDVCTVRYDCYTLSPIIPAAAGSRNNGRHEQQQQRKRTWIDGNFNHTKTGKMCIIEEEKKLLLLLENENEIKAKKNDDQLLSQKLPFRHHPHHHLQNDDDNRLLSLPLEFEIGRGDVIRGLEVGVQRMYVGDIIEITIPHLFAYSERGHDHNYLQSQNQNQNQINDNDDSLQVFVNKLRGDIRSLLL
ncbi:hypothetical protein FRACYDRAFT_233018 [Fragilariopsis cylindrus CCMP1102]|uniref:peptidylprolyl isomerase n=1 Tax=Fragilariopsis cylindrus CCMP1102 TaxID=635003 RepID=A0A1E7FXJ4_9STRA|nr:hypothetical protein FRACYDRAFT_233018 [Fragilariopsis cylindrus CCMP1102]|eukprot:OEU22854.1 hypothetical protein FRACYDRAFT_233018 [Fragilariopsis cylindrus CCMP1102]